LGVGEDNGSDDSRGWFSATLKKPDERRVAMHVLIAYGSKMGGTAEIAGMLADDLKSEGLTCDPQPADTVKSLDGYDAVIVGGALYANRWSGPSRRFVKQHTGELSTRPVFFFSSGPLDGGATERDIPPIRQVRRLMERVGAHEHVTFGGRLPADAKGFPARSMAKTMSGDWRDPDQIRAWAQRVATSLRTVDASHAS
jgi:menaquinone-dependent protoporphyrinogen oxidase